MWSTVELPNIHDIVFVLEDSGFVIVNVKVVWSGEDSHDAGEASCSSLAVHSISGVLGFMRSDDGKEIVFLQKIAGSRIGKEVRATTDVIVNKELRGLFLTKFLQWVGPENITHQTVSWRFAKSVNLNTSV